MLERVATIVGVVAILAAIGFYAWPRLFPEPPPEVSEQGGARLDPARVLAALAAAERTAPERTAPEGADRTALIALQGATEENAPARIESIRADIEKNGETAVRLGALGWLLQVSREPEEAKETLERALALDPRCSVAHVAKALGHMRFGRFVEAEEPLRSALAENPRVSEWNRMLAVVLLAQGRPRRALRAAERAVLLDPGERHGYLAVGDVHLREARLPEAVAWYEAAIELAGGSDSELAQRHEPVLAALRERAAKP